MKQRAIIYTRVSTDEQNNGYSPADQKDKINKYCEHNNIEIVGFYHDDESGKSFDRPEWIKIMSFIKKNRNYVDNIIFLKWDRFSRNVAEAYITIRDLKKLGVEPQAIEQPLDFEIPESKIMLAIYLAAPEVDNDRRALNVFHGIRRAKKEGRWLGNCLRGYKNSRDENNRPIISHEGGKQQMLVEKAFKEFASGMYNIEELRRKLNREGLKCNRNSFWMLLRNKGYIGKIMVPAYKDEPAQWVDGIHDPLIDNVTFYEVQDIIMGRKKNLPNKYKTVRDEMPLRGFLACPRCGRNLTGSASRGKLGGKFYYYHCDRNCKERQKAKDANERFSQLLGDFKSKPTTMVLYAQILKDKLKQNNNTGKSELEKVYKEIAKQKQRLKNAKDLMLDGEFSASEYKEMKNEIDETIHLLSNDELKMKEGLENHDVKIDSCLELLSTLDTYYDARNTITKQRIVGSIFPEKLIFENNKYRTPRINEVVDLICRKDKPFGGEKKEKQSISELLSLEVRMKGLEPPRLSAPDPKSGAAANYATSAFIN
jgi:site-specific DNA recombinase